MPASATTTVAMSTMRRTIAERASGNTGKRLVRTPKVYVRESGLTHALLDRQGLEGSVDNSAPLGLTV